MSNPLNRDAPCDVRPDRLGTPSSPGVFGLLGRYGVITWLAVAINAMGYLGGIGYADFQTGLFAVTALLGHSAVFVLVALAPAAAIAGIARGLGDCGRSLRQDDGCGA